MANSTIQGGQHPSGPVRQMRLQPRTHRAPLAVRRLAAWTIELSLVTVSTLIPFQIGLYARSHYQGETVPLNPVLVKVEAGIASTLAIPIGTRNQRVAPLTNLFWSIALVSPLALVGSQLYWLGKTGKTHPRHWLGIQVVTATGTPPGLVRVLGRELLGKWGLPSGTAYLIWQYSGAFPGVGILAGLTGICLLGAGLSAQLNRQRRALHDRLAGTYVLTAAQSLQAHPEWFQSVLPRRRGSPLGRQTSTDWVDEDGAITAIVLSPDPTWQRRGLWQWILRHPGLTLTLASLAGTTLILGTFVGTQIYIQNQVNWRDTRQQDDQLFLALVDKLASTSEDAVLARGAAILTLGTLPDQRAIPLLVDLLAQEKNTSLLGPLQQALVTSGPDALRPLQRLNQSLSADLEAFRFSHNRQEQMSIVRRRRATQQAIAKILTIYSGQVHGVDLNRTHFSQIKRGAGQFTLVLDQIDLAGIKLREASLTGASARNSRFYGPGKDKRFNTYDDWIADLSNAQLDQVDFTAATLNHAVMNQVSLVRAVLNSADLAQAHLSRANLSSASLTQAQLPQAILENASLTGADLTNANFTQANLREARLGQVSAVGARFQSASLIRSDWQGADLSSADLSRADLQHANFSDTRLAGANLSSAQLQNASFRNANLSSVDLRGADVEGTDFQSARFTMPALSAADDQFIAIAPTPHASDLLQDVDFTSAKNLDPQQLQHICAHGGKHPSCSF
ncbi:MAG: hypothetical protein F6K19_04245 [Cyanothece sp. SIO1E1]|nr:hypothetical protein [Cyanothece sp. SIO1E1]